MDKKEIKKIMKKTWWFIWESDSIWSWIVNIILAFILIKFIVYPGLGFALATTHPIVAVVSGSMEHDGSFDQWWNSDAICSDRECIQALHYSGYGITKEIFLDFRFSDGFNKGDIMILRGPSPEKIDVGDTIIFTSKRPYPIIHRVIQKWEQDGKFYFKTKGDHNFNSVAVSSLDETKISEDQIIGKAVLRVPYLGWIKLAAVKIWNFARPR